MSRSKWKNPYTKQFGKNKRKKILTIKRSYEITPHIIGKTFKVHNGKIFTKLTTTEEMIGHKIGEFIPTRVKFTFKKSKNK